MLYRQRRESSTIFKVGTKKHKWSSSFKFLAVLLNYTLGLQSARKGAACVLKTKARGANILIFPVLTFLVATPMIFMNLVMGQYSGKTTVKVWDMCPIFRGVGIVSFVNFAVYQMYNLMWTTYGLYYSLTPFMVDNEWDTCNKSWADINCYTTDSNYSQRIYCYKKLSFDECNNMLWYTSTQMYFVFHVLNTDRKNWNLGPLNYKLMPYGLATTALVYLANFNGVKTLEAYLTVLFFVPFLMATVILFFTLLHPGALMGVRSMFDMDFPEIVSLDFWTYNVACALYISGVAFGNHIVFGSQCNFREDLHFKSVITIVGECMFLLLYSVLTMMLIGIIGYESNSAHAWLVLLRPDTTMFATLPDAVGHLVGSKMFWVWFYYIFVFLMGYRSQVVMVCNNLEVIYDMFPRLRQYDKTCILLWCILLFLGSLVFYTRIGYHYLIAVEFYWFISNLPFICAVEVFGVVYVYGLNKFLDDASFMLGIKAPGYFRIAYILFPFVFCVTYFYRIKDHFSHRFQQDMKGPEQFWYIQNFCLWNNFFVICGYSLYCLFKYFVLKRGRNPFLPTLDWGPCESNLTKSRQMFTAHSMTKEYIYRQQRFKKRFITNQR